MIKRFPIMSLTRGGGDSEPGAPGFSVPWCMAEKAYATYVRKLGNIQTLERIAERGGFSWLEFVLLYCNSSMAWVGAKHLSARHLQHYTQRVVVDLLAWEEKS